MKFKVGRNRKLQHLGIIQIVLPIEAAKAICVNQTILANPVQQSVDFKSSKETRDLQTSLDL